MHCERQTKQSYNIITDTLKTVFQHIHIQKQKNTLNLFLISQRSKKLTLNTLLLFIMYLKFTKYYQQSNWTTHIFKSSMKDTFYKNSSGTNMDENMPALICIILHLLEFHMQGSVFFKY